LGLPTIESLYRAWVVRVTRYDSNLTVKCILDHLKKGFCLKRFPDDLPAGSLTASDEQVHEGLNVLEHALSEVEPVCHNRLRPK
jgi:hypothetical protein